MVEFGLGSNEGSHEIDEERWIPTSIWSSFQISSAKVLQKVQRESYVDFTIFKYITRYLVLLIILCVTYLKI